jgi:hypothetical protein
MDTDAAIAVIKLVSAVIPVIAPFVIRLFKKA